VLLQRPCGQLTRDPGDQHTGPVEEDRGGHAPRLDRGSHDIARVRIVWRGGAVTDLPVHKYEDKGEIKILSPTEVTLSDRREYELAEQGFIGLTVRKGTDNATFFSANSEQKANFFGTDPEAKEAETNYRLGTQLPYLFVVNRLAHYIKVLQRENIGSWKTKNDLDRELNNWIRQYVADQDPDGYIIEF
jgi:type VI secretion system protein ImpC